MSRTERLFDLLQALRRRRNPVAGRVLAGELGVSLRTLYRDIATLQAQGAEIDGEPGLGYVLRPSFLLPPLMFTAEEIEALALGSTWVAGQEDAPLAAAARDVLVKIGAVLPSDLRDHLDDNGLLVVAGGPTARGPVDIGVIRRAIRDERKLRITYCALPDDDGRERETRRTIWPFGIAFFERVRLVAAWCELRGDFRHFRTDRIMTARVSERRYPKRRRALHKEWKARQAAQCTA